MYESVTEMVLVLELAAGGELQHILDGGQCLGEVIRFRCLSVDWVRLISAGHAIVSVACDPL